MFPLSRDYLMLAAAGTIIALSAAVPIVQTSPRTLVTNTIYPLRVPPMFYPLM